MIFEAWGIGVLNILDNGGKLCGTWFILFWLLQGVSGVSKIINIAAVLNILATPIIVLGLASSGQWVTLVTLLVVIFIANVLLFYRQYTGI